MENCAETIGLVKRFNTDSFNTDNSWYFRLRSILPELLLNRFLFFIKPIVEYAFGIHIGFAIGWPLGLYAGDVYVEHFKPVYFFDLNKLQQWELMPYEFARNGAVIGAVIGVITIAIINSRLLNQRVISLYEKRITAPKAIARALGKSERQIQRVINKLTKKEKNRKKTYSQKDYQAEGPIPLEPVVGMCEIPWKLEKIFK